MGEVRGESILEVIEGIVMGGGDRWGSWEVILGGGEGLGSNSPFPHLCCIWRYLSSAS